MDDWKIWFKLFLLSIFINLCLVCGGVYFKSQFQELDKQYLQSVADLEKRNGELSAGLDIARAESARNLELFVDLRASIKRATDQSRAGIEDARRLKDTAQRIDAIAGVLVKAIEDIIKANYLLENVDLDSVNGSSD